MSIELKIGFDIINSYRRLAYTPWHAIAEFVDNSTQSYFDNRAILDEIYREEKSNLTVSIVYDRDTSILRISDNAMGMSYEELENALHVAKPPSNTNGRSKYGMGLKTSASWIGNKWTIKTKKLHETIEHNVTISVQDIASGNNKLPYTAITDRDPKSHYTVIIIEDHNRKFIGRTVSKIKDFLSSMYREDFRNNVLTLLWQNEKLQWHDIDDRLLVDPSGLIYKKNFEFDVDNKRVYGVVGILKKGSRAEAGFSIIHCGRVVKGWPDSWRPSSLYGQIQGSNDLVNQRLVGEIHLDAFDVSHTKDDILWLGDQEDTVEDKLLEHCGDYKEFAKEYRKRTDTEIGPSEIETSTAIDELEKELTSPEMVDEIKIEEELRNEETLEGISDKILQDIDKIGPATINAMIGPLSIKIWITKDLSPNDPYVTVEASKASEVHVIVNIEHPHWSQLKGSEGVLNYLRHCTYDAIAEWKARSQLGSIKPNTIKIFKDHLLRIPFEINDQSRQDTSS